MTRKQQIELFYAEPILNYLDIRDSVVSADSPDLRYKDKGLHVGIEVVCCYPDEDEPGSFNMMENRTREACRDYSAKLKQEGNKGIIVFVSFTDAAYEPDKTVSTRLFKQIVFQEIARKKEQYESEQRLRTHDVEDDYFKKMIAGYYDCKYVESVSWDRLSDCDIVEIIPVRTGYCTTLDAKYVLTCIDKKEKKLVKYKEKIGNKAISEYWLFICNPSNAFSDLEGFIMPEFKSSFDRVYLTDRGKVLLLK